MTAPGPSLRFFDTHAHLNLLPPDCPFEEAFERAISKGLSGLVNIGTRIDSSRESIALADRFDNIWATVGIHPSEAASMTGSARETLDELSRHPKVVGVGETGLDVADIPETPMEIQRHALVGHLELAFSRNLPLILHCRDAFVPLFDILDSETLPERRGVFHCFTGGSSEAKGALDRGFYLSFSGIVTFRNAQSLRDLLPAVPIDRILIETDCPYLAPVPYRGKTNEPAYLPETLKVVADVLGQDPLQLSEQLLENTRRFFGILF
ncbi:MAG: TatD family hydrolase [Nitrospirota bacterium]|nr:TatD family hydrolase [Nitrospirota bacterium]